MLVKLQGGATHPGDLLLRLAALAQDEGRVHVAELHHLPAALEAAVARLERPLASRREW